MDTGVGRTQERLHDWDFSRALYLVLGIPFHAAVIYSLSHEWSVSSPDKSQALTWFANFLHTFRMPGFFILAGMFSIMLLDRQGARAWLKSRLIRLGVPLVFATLLILPFQIVVQSVALTVSGALPMSELQSHIARELTHFGEPWISHLWFLWALTAYCVGLAALHALIGGRGLRALAEGGVAWVGDNRILSLAAFAAICELAALAQTEVTGASPYYGNAVINYNLYAPYFGLGVVLFYSRTLQDLLLKAGVRSFAAGVALVSLSQLPYAGLFTHTLTVIAGLIGAVLIVGFISNLARRHFSRSDPRIRGLVDASFTIYLFHHPVVYVLATLFLLVNLPPLLEFALIAPAAGLIAYGIHLAVSRSAVLTLMFNGVMPKQARAAPTVLANEPLAMSIARPYPWRG
ncbi:MAG: acyltransferase family protein [Hoeflea sp.]|uniref:acyltransferase family protein n=1 Tax=Hoeflea sp. TaxID=1940281 RepID=UPI001DF6754A|nr:acyltransferase family protein [Hoeflea sp.]MBU4530201.1 acyltransferase family protein [Alphaproteobacteria bacterium]MBU4542514.1 acyltransferase family protein [Alphaproteobacteria bacterium]MBU4551195.1 acyltransferase family protein [Alphaproteobacteria bacterium]MBV1723018.1 acyltransferase family protein [Hoeflea sp.]MBV1760029.1 acyltransferase family protein [Hoeflea sp.]